REYADQARCLYASQYGFIGAPGTLIFTLDALYQNAGNRPGHGHVNHSLDRFQTPQDRWGFHEQREHVVGANDPEEVPYAKNCDEPGGLGIAEEPGSARLIFFHLHVSHRPLKTMPQDGTLRIRKKYGATRSRSVTRRQSLSLGTSFVDLKSTHFTSIATE